MTAVKHQHRQDDADTVCDHDRLQIHRIDPFVCSVHSSEGAESILRIRFCVYNPNIVPQNPRQQKRMAGPVLRADKAGERPEGGEEIREAGAYYREALEMDRTLAEEALRELAN